MIRVVLLSLAGLLVVATGARAADVCQDYVRLTELPKTFKSVSVSAIGPATLNMMSDGKCTCNDLPAVQRHFGQSEPDGVNWACFPADATDMKDK